MFLSLITGSGQTIPLTTDNFLYKVGRTIWRECDSVGTMIESTKVRHRARSLLHEKWHSLYSALAGAPPTSRYLISDSPCILPLSQHRLYQLLQHNPPNWVVCAYVPNFKRQVPHPGIILGSLSMHHGPLAHPPQRPSSTTG